MRIERGQTYTISKNTDFNEIIENYGTLRLDPNVSVKVTNRQSIINYGLFQSKPANKDIIHDIQFLGVNMNMQGIPGKNLDDPNAINMPAPPLVPGDVGFWNWEGGTWDVVGASKKPYTTLAANANIGATQIVVKDATGWNRGDLITINPIHKPPMEPRFWNSDAKRYEDSFLKFFEERYIVDISGGTITLDKPLEYNHHSVTTQANILAPQGRIFHCYVNNNTRNVRIHGAPGGYSHIYFHTKTTKTVHNIRNIEVYHMGPTKQVGHRHGIPGKILGRYAMHWQSTNDLTEGTMVTGCAFHHIGSRTCVPHKANGIQIRNNSFYNCLGEIGWYEFQDMSHNVMYCNNLGSAILWDGYQLGGTAYLLGIGDNNMCINNVLVYGNQGDPDGSGGYQWTTDNEGVWLFDNNQCFASNNADWTWQNSGRPHAITRSVVLNCNFAVTHGAYGNAYLYALCEHYYSMTKIRASGQYQGGFLRCVFDGMGFSDQNPHLRAGEPRPFQYDNNLVDIWSSAVPGLNQFKHCEFKNAGKGIVFDLFLFNDDNATPRFVEAINCIWTNCPNEMSFRQAYRGSNLPTYYMRRQDGNTARQYNLNGTTYNIPKFAPDLYGSGDGLKCEYYKGMNFEQKVLELVEAYPRHDDWRVDLPKMPGGVHYKLNDGAFSVRYSGEIQAYYTKNIKFRCYGGSGYRLWIGGNLVINSPGNKHDNAEFAESPGSVSFTNQERKKIILEVYEPGDRNRGIELRWDALGLGWQEVEYSQLYSLVPYTTFPPSVPPVYPPTPPNPNPEVPPVVPPTPPQPDPEDPTPPSDPTDPCKTYIEADYLFLNPDVAKAVNDGVFANGLAHYNKFGKMESRKINRQCGVAKVYKNARIERKYQRNNCGPGMKGLNITMAVAAGTYASTVSQADADQQAIKFMDTYGQQQANAFGQCAPDINAVNPCTVFKEADYLQLNTDIAAAVERGEFPSGFIHYERYGRNEGRKINLQCQGAGGSQTAPPDPCKIFIEQDYLDLNPDVKAQVLNGNMQSGAWHYERFGKNEGRKINKLCP